jgi:SAM-dependent methyltransferase
MGVEVKAEDCAELARLGLPHRQVDGGLLPFNDGSFDTAMCVEVLEHIDDPHAFLAEIRRVSRRLLVSVPNIELVSYLAPFQVVPWHMLEGDHKNFFTRWGLRGLLQRYFTRVEVFGYSACPLRSIEGTRLDYHLFAVASS